jgi:DNA-damage-inducible protein J
MTRTNAITVRLDAHGKDNAKAILKELGLTTTQAVSLFFKRVILNKGLPFTLEIPNEKTIQATEDGLNNRNLKTFENAEAALDALIQQTRA